MSVFLLGSNGAKPQAAFGGGPSDSEALGYKNWLLAAGHSIPLMWIFLFKAQDLLDHPIGHDEACELKGVRIPCVETKVASARLRDRGRTISAWFCPDGLDYHIDMFCAWLDTLPYAHVSLDWYEFMAEEGVTMEYLEDLLTCIEMENAEAIPMLIRISHIDPHVRFITLQDASTGDFNEAEKDNFFCLMGDGDNHTPPWA